MLRLPSGLPVSRIPSLVPGATAFFHAKPKTPQCQDGDESNKDPRRFTVLFPYGDQTGRSPFTSDRAEAQQLAQENQVPYAEVTIESDQPKVTAIYRQTIPTSKDE